MRIALEVYVNKILFSISNMQHISMRTVN